MKMGLDFRGANARWSYGGFNRFRNRLVAEAGHPGTLDDLFDKHIIPPGLDKDGIWPLINHSDCDGELTVEEMRLVEPRLRELVSRWPENDYDRLHGLLLADGMRQCIDEGEVLVFT